MLGTLDRVLHRLVGVVQQRGLLEGVSPFSWTGAGEAIGMELAGERAELLVQARRLVERRRDPEQTELVEAGSRLGRRLHLGAGGANGVPCCDLAAAAPACASAHRKLRWRRTRRSRTRS